MNIKKFLVAGLLATSLFNGANAELNKFQKIAALLFRIPVTDNAIQLYIQRQMFLDIELKVAIDVQIKHAITYTLSTEDLIHIYYHQRGVIETLSKYASQEICETILNDLIIEKAKSNNLYQNFLIEMFSIPIEERINEVNYILEDYPRYAKASSILYQRKYDLNQQIDQLLKESILKDTK